MPIISTIGRRQPKMRLFIALLYVALVAGAVTMVYPFLLMVSLSFTSTVDQHEFRVIPRYWYNDAVLFRKYEESKYSESIDGFNRMLAMDAIDFEHLALPAAVSPAAVRDWQAFAARLPLDHVNLAHQGTVSHLTAESLWRYRAFLQRKFHSIEAYNAAYHEANAGWNEQTQWGEPVVNLPVDLWDERQTKALDTEKYRDFLAFKRSLPARYRLPVSMDGTWAWWLRLTYGKDVRAIARRHGARYQNWADMHLAARVPAQPALAADWLRFVREECPFHFIRLDPAAAGGYRAALRAKYGSLGALNTARQTSYTDWAQVPAPTAPPAGDIPLLDWTDYVKAGAPARYIELRTPEILYREGLKRQYGTIAGLNKAYGSSYARFDQVTPPRLASDWAELQADRPAIRTEFVLRNYRDVVGYILMHGRAIWNTAVLVIGLLVVTLIVNPLAAYALSRYQLPGTYKILLFLLATMAFPAEVTMIPGFLLLKSAHLLNTYWALILPAMASGYSIFLLKGFFDSLPQDLYESAMLDGAPEWVMFGRITVPLSKPVLAVIALGTFTAAYGSFMWAFLVCQDPKMWTLMVWLFQMQIWAPQFMIFAALTLAAIPTLLVFIFCQNIIMRGIILPVEK